ncbi:subtilisin-like protease [Olea europaea subsp. europaea]|uniref:Subtilisin-like protease n=1 Tax=Olea europaea subsp. europaea TaxID=158383 RepID=A0A8S0V9T9_OLEEU|nr:subtilisin-like protease [Olea europaea subsp. europaea]
MNSGRDTKGHGIRTSSTIARNHVDGASFFGYIDLDGIRYSPFGSRTYYNSLFWCNGERSKDVPVLIDYVTKGAKPVASIKFQQTFFGAKLASMVASLASHGPALSIAAFLKGADTEWSPASICSAVMTIASPFDSTQNYILDLGLDRKFAAPLAMGAGQVKPNGALSPSLIYDIAPQDYINLLCR